MRGGVELSWTAKKQTKRGEMTNRYAEPKETMKEIKDLPIADLSDRGIRKEIAEIFGVRMAVSQEDGKTPTAVYFPYFDQSDKVCGYKKRDLTADKMDDRHFTVIGKVSIGCQLFGQQIASKIQRKRNNLIHVEGEYDVLSYYQAGLDQAARGGWKDFAPFVVGLSLGTANAVDAVLSNAEFVESFHKNTLLYDADEATLPERKKGIKKGKEATNDVATALMSDEVYIAKPPQGCKDPNDALLMGVGDSMVKSATFDAKKFIGEKIVTASEITLDMLTEKRPEGIYVETFPDLMRKLHGFRTRELIVLTAPSNVGKSFVCAEFAYNFLESGKKVGFMYLEEQNKETVQRMLARKLKVNYNKFRDNPLSCATQEQIQDAYNWLTHDRECLLLDHFGSMPITEFMNKINVMHKLHKCEYIIVDHLSMLISGSKVSDERKELDLVMTELAAFCAANDVCIIAVSHLNRSIASDFKPPKGKEDEPHWIPVTKEAMRGSSSLEQLAWCVLGLEPQILPDKSRGNVRLTVLKNRTFGYLGISDEFSMDEQTGLLKVVNQYSGGF